MQKVNLMTCSGHALFAKPNPNQLSFFSLADSSGIDDAPDA